MLAGRTPTSRHRRRFVMHALRRVGVCPSDFVFDYGCGTGLLLEEIKNRYRLGDDQLGGCDLSEEAVRATRRLFQSPYFFHGERPAIDRPIDIAITTEVIEHTAQYENILTWLRDHLRMGGHLIVTTPGGTMDPPDVYYGHIQHFELDHLTGLLERLGFSLKIARYWGFRLFTLQKWITKKNFDRIRDEFMGGDLNTRKKLIFNLAYYLYFIHDLINRGPQIFVLAEKTGDYKLSI